MATHRRSRLAWDNFLVGVIGLVFAVAFGTAAAILAEAGHYPAAIALAVAAVLFALPATVQALGELLTGVLMVGMLLGSVVLLPALLVSPSLRRWAKRYWARATA
ncbi:hypothetical protein IU433_09880 [Nocardia puris]|uniref:Uncharacterized protein n=1 Tax=Nocardia puris TaxID=208602 RepID=A0A366DRI2_9NOCA|nr:hypothetical protein [Nocardia puris]MBF6364415.1 hypothetical protein [Nocardia puris]MBF6459344.1 hypothetical protein [Nocardia puris]RBO92696.1 hypothetical protein DFR74_103340 [Nocardia puris]